MVSCCYCHLILCSVAVVCAFFLWDHPVAVFCGGNLLLFWTPADVVSCCCSLLFLLWSATAVIFCCYGLSLLKCVFAFVSFGYVLLQLSSADPVVCSCYGMLLVWSVTAEVTSGAVLFCRRGALFLQFVLAVDTLLLYSVETGICQCSGYLVLCYGVCRLLLLLRSATVVIGS